MSKETVFRSLFILAFIAVIVIRSYYQLKILLEKRRSEIKESSLGPFVGGIATLTVIVFGIEYIFHPGFFCFAYVIGYPEWIRWLGGFALTMGIFLLGSAHHHLGKNFHSLIVSKEDQALVETGPYQWIRHPIYTAYLINYISGGLLSGNLVLTFVPATLYIIFIGLRLGREEKIMESLFGQRYIEYEKRTGRLIPQVNKKLQIASTKHEEDGRDSSR